MSETVTMKPSDVVAEAAKAATTDPTGNRKWPRSLLGHTVDCPTEVCDFGAVKVIGLESKSAAPRSLRVRQPSESTVHKIDEPTDPVVFTCIEVDRQTGRHVGFSFAVDEGEMAEWTGANKTKASEG